MNVKELFQAVNSGNFQKFVSIFQEVKKQDFDISQCRLEKTGDSPLHVMCRLGRLAMIQYLSENGFRIHFGCKNYEDKTLLHEASQFCQDEVVEFLLENGAQVDAIKRADWTPVMLACTKRDNLPVLTRLVKAGADLTLVNKDGWTPFHLAAREGDLEMLKYLLENNANLWQTQSKNGRTPLHTAALSGNDQTVQFLLDNCNYPPDCKDSCGSTPLMDYIRSGHFSSIQHFTSKDFDLRSLDRFGRNCLHIASQSGQCQTIKILVKDWNMNVNEVSDNGMSSLHWAVFEKQIEAVKTLLDLNCDKDLKDKKNKSAKDIANELGYENIAQIL